MGGAVDSEGGWDASWAGVFVETGAGRGLDEDDPMRARREEGEQLILGGLLRVNLGRGSREEKGETGWKPVLLGDRGGGARAAVGRCAAGMGTRHLGGFMGSSFRW